MRLLKTGLAAVLAATMIAAVSARVQVQNPTALDAYRAVCAQENAGYVAGLRKEIATIQRQDPQQKTFTAQQERERVEAYFNEAMMMSPKARKEFEGQFAEIWRQAGESMEKPELLMGACHISVANAWAAGLRDFAQIKQNWAQARASIYKLPGATSTPPASSPSPARPASNPAAPDGYAEPVDCVRLNDTPGSFKNVCDFPVYFTYCGVSPAKGSWVAECSKQSYGLLDIAARGVQGGFTGAETIYMLACKSPKTPKDVTFVGTALRGTCK